MRVCRFAHAFVKVKENLPKRTRIPTWRDIPPIPGEAHGADTEEVAVAADLGRRRTRADYRRSWGRSDLVELFGDDGVLDEEFEGNDLEGGFVGGFEEDGAGCSGLLYLEPARGTDAPAVAGFEAGEAELGHGRGEVVAERLGGVEEGCVDDATDGVDAEVVGTGLAAAVAIKAGHRGAAAGGQGLAKNIFAAGFNFGVHGSGSIVRRGSEPCGGAAGMGGAGRYIFRPCEVAGDFGYS